MIHRPGHILSAVVLLCITLGCGEGSCSRSAAPREEEPAALVQTLPDTQFISLPVPPEVEARIRGVSYPADALIPLEDLRYLKLSYVGYDGLTHQGEMICNRQIAADLTDIFRQLYLAGYPIALMRLIDDFGGSDQASMESNNTSCFNYRRGAGLKRLSAHAYGLAVDVNPLENPFVKRGVISPASGAPYVDRTRDFPHKITRDDLCYKLFIAHGFTWGGAWRSSKDYQHFEKQ